MVFSPTDIDQLERAGRLDPDELAFYRQHLTPMRSVFVDQDTQQLVTVWQHYYRCDRYDVETRRCGDYEHRPDVCRGFPWYGDPPDRDKSLPPTCSYRADVGLPVEPVAVADPIVRHDR